MARFCNLRMVCAVRWHGVTENDRWSDLVMSLLVRWMLSIRRDTYTVAGNVILRQRNARYSEPAASHQPCNEQWNNVKWQPTLMVHSVSAFIFLCSSFLGFRSLLAFHNIIFLFLPPRNLNRGNVPIFTWRQSGMLSLTHNSHTHTHRHQTPAFKYVHALTLNRNKF